MPPVQSFKFTVPDRIAPASRFKVACARLVRFELGDSSLNLIGYVWPFDCDDVVLSHVFREHRRSANAASRRSHTRNITSHRSAQANSAVQPLKTHEIQQNSSIRRAGFHQASDTLQSQMGE
ncbi:hypothetical protein SCARD494_08751 [Seiridium cardinale]